MTLCILIKPNFEETFYSLKCGACHEAIVSSVALFHVGGEELFQVPNPCLFCGAAVDRERYVRLVKQGRTHIHQAETQLAKGTNQMKALTNLNETLKVYNKVLHRFHEELMKLQDLLAKICFELGDPMNSLVHIRRVIETVKYR